MALAKKNLGSQTQSAVEDSNNNKENFIKNGPKESVGGVDPVKVEN